MTVLPDSWFDMSLGSIANGQNREVDWPGCTLSWLQNDFSMWKVPNVLFWNESSTSHRNPDVEFIDLILPPLSVRFAPKDLTLLLTIQPHERGWLVKYYLSEGPARRSGLRFPTFVILTRKQLTSKRGATEIFPTDWWSGLETLSFDTCWIWSTSTGRIDY